MNKNEIAYAIKRFLKGNGFYLALGLCLVAVLTLAVTTAGGDLPPVDGESRVPSPTESQTESLLPSEPEEAPESDAEEAGKTESGVEDETPSDPEPSLPDDGPSEPEEKPTDTPPMPDKNFYLPTENAVSLGYSEEKLVFSDTLGDWRTHLATDFEGEAGDRITAVSYGTVIDVYDDELYGTTVVIEHEKDILSKYSGLRNITVKSGDTVTAKSVIGELSGDIPIEQKDGVHLHFEMIKNGEQIDIFTLTETK